ncbi:MAG: prevent-host-death protein [Chitinivibrionales bacterium]|nr:prevent-host-death protein [Chitinivibrionales bacterium]
MRYILSIAMFIAILLGVRMITVSKGVLKNRMLEYFRNVEKTGEELIVTDHRKPVLKVVPLKKEAKLKETFARYQGKAIYHAPVDGPETGEWGDLA